MASVFMTSFLLNTPGCVREGGSRFLPSWRLSLEIQQVELQVGLGAADALVGVDHGDVQPTCAFLVILHVLVVIQLPCRGFLGVLLLESRERGPVQLLGVRALLGPPAQLHGARPLRRRLFHGVIGVRRRRRELLAVPPVEVDGDVLDDAQEERLGRRAPARHLLGDATELIQPAVEELADRVLEELVRVRWGPTAVARLNLADDVPGRPVPSLDQRTERASNGLARGAAADHLREQFVIRELLEHRKDLRAVPGEPPREMGLQGCGAARYHVGIRRQPPSGAEDPGHPDDRTDGAPEEARPSTRRFPDKLSLRKRGRGAGIFRVRNPERSRPWPHRFRAPGPRGPTRSGSTPRTHLRVDDAGRSGTELVNQPTGLSTRALTLSLEGTVSCPPAPSSSEISMAATTRPWSCSPSWGPRPATASSSPGTWWTGAPSPVSAWSWRCGTRPSSATTRRSTSSSATARMTGCCRTTWRRARRSTPSTSTGWRGCPTTSGCPSTTPSSCTPACCPTCPSRSRTPTTCSTPSASSRPARRVAGRPRHRRAGSSGPITGRGPSGSSSDTPSSTSRSSPSTRWVSTPAACMAAH